MNNEKRNAIPIVSNIYDGSPFTAFVIANPITDDDDCTDGKVIARCQHQHREYNNAYTCAVRLWQRRCPALWRQMEDS